MPVSSVDLQCKTSFCNLLLGWGLQVRCVQDCRSAVCRTEGMLCAFMDLSLLGSVLMDEVLSWRSGVSVWVEAPLQVSGWLST